MRRRVILRRTSTHARADSRHDVKLNRPIDPPLLRAFRSSRIPTSPSGDTSSGLVVDKTPALQTLTPVLLSRSTVSPPAAKGEPVLRLHSSFSALPVKRPYVRHQHAYYAWSMLVSGSSQLTSSSRRDCVTYVDARGKKRKVRESRAEVEIGNIVISAYLVLK